MCNTISDESWRNKNRISICAGISNQHSLSRVTLQDRLYSVASRDRFRFDFARRAFNFACEYAFVTVQRDLTFRAAYRSASGFTHVRAIYYAYTFTCKRSYILMWPRFHPYFKSNNSSITSKSHTQRNTNN